MSKKVLVSCILMLMIFQTASSAVLAVIQPEHPTNTVGAITGRPNPEENTGEETEQPEENANPDEESVGVDDPGDPPPKESQNGPQEEDQTVGNVAPVVPPSKTPPVTMPNVEVDETTYLAPTENISPLAFPSPVAFTRAGSAEQIWQIDLFTNGTAAERSINIDSVLSSVRNPARILVANTKRKHSHTKRMAETTQCG